MWQFVSLTPARGVYLTAFLFARRPGLLLLSALLLAALVWSQQDSALAWKPYTHTKTIEPALDEVVRTGSVLINGRSYRVRREIVEALTDHPEFYNAGTIGPDGFPDIIFGQSIIHPENTGAWLRHLHDHAWAAQSDSSYTAEEKSQILAFTYGYLTHAAGDVWAHTLVNDFSDGIFPAVKEIATDVEAAKIALRHIIVEGYIGAATAGFDSDPERGPAPFGDTSDDSTPGLEFDAPHRFIYETLINPGANTPAADRGVHLDLFIELRNAIENQVDKESSKPLDELVSAYNDSVDNLAIVLSDADAALAACNIAVHLAALIPGSPDNANCLTALEKLGISSVDSFEAAVSGAEKTATASVNKAFDLLADGYFSEWVEDIDTGLEHWNELGLATTNAMFDPQATRDVQNKICRFEGTENSLIREQCESEVTIADVLLDQSDDFINAYLISMLGAPDAVGGLREALAELSGPLDLILGALGLPLNPIKETDAQIDEFAKNLVLQMVEDRFGIDIEQVKEFVTHPTYWINAESQQVTIPGLGTQSIEFFSADSHERLDEIMGLPPDHHVPSNFPEPGASTRLADDSLFDPEKFAPFKNSVVTAKLLLLDSKGLNSVLNDALSDSREVRNPPVVNMYRDNNVSPGNIMTDGLDGEPWLLSIDADHAWRVDALPRFPDRKPGVLPHGGTGLFPVWESCTLRPAFRVLFTDWENDDDRTQSNFPDLRDNCSNVEQIPERTVEIDTGGLTAVFDWSMPDRLGQDDNRDGLMDYYTTSISDNLPEQPLVMERWRVDFDACDSVPGNRAIAQYLWKIDGNEQRAVVKCDGFSYDQFPGEGTYEVTLTVVDADGREASQVATVVVQDWLILSFGDSYASGEGVPDIPLAFDKGFWVSVCSLDPFGITRGFMEDGRCYSVPPLGIPGIVTPEVPELCNGGFGFFERGDCWTIPPIAGVPGPVIPAHPALCNLGNGTFVDDECWTLVETIGVPGVETPAISAICLGTFQSGECWTTLPTSVDGYKGPATAGICIPMGDLDLFFNPDSNCSVNIPGIYGVITPAVPATCVTVFVDGECWLIFPVEGVPGVLTPATPALCNGSQFGFSRSGDCWLVPPGIGQRGIITPAIPASCIGDRDEFDKDGNCWRVPPSGGVTIGAMIVEGCFADGSGLIPGVVSPFGGSRQDGAECFGVNTDLSDLSPTWENDECNRSANSGHTKAALAIEEADPRTSVTFVHLACSGDVTTDLPRQFDEANALIGDREVDAVVISIGGNDVKFGPIIQACIMQEECFEDDFRTVGGTIAPIACLFATPLGKFSECEDFVTGVGGGPDDPSAQKMFFDAIFGEGCDRETSECRALLDLYQNLEEVDLPELNGLIPLDSDAQRPERVYMVQYPDLTKDDSLNYCNPVDHPLPSQTLPGGSRAESTWADEVTTFLLNDGVRKGAAAAGWRYVDGIYEGFSRHGYCAVDHWVVRLYESIQVQGEIRGAVHPTDAGNEFSAGRIARALTADFYENSDLSMPRRPDQPDALELISEPVIVAPSTDDLTVSFRGPSTAVQGENVGDKFTLSVSNSGFAGRERFTGEQRFSRDQGFVVDIVLSADERVPVGKAPTSDVFEEDALLSGGRITLSSDLARGDTSTLSLRGVSLRGDTPAGKYFLCARADTGNNVAESNERNNVSCVSIRIAEASVVMPSLSIDQKQAEPGSRVTASGTNFPPRTPLVIAIDDLGVSKTTTDVRGNFSQELLVPDLPEGRVTVTALLGNTIIESTSTLQILAKSAVLVEPNVSIKSATATLIVASRTATPGRRIKVPISLKGVDNFGSMNFQILYDPTVLAVDLVEIGDLVRGTQFQSNSDEDGVISFGLVVGRGSISDGPVAHVTFSVIGSDGESTDLILSKLFATDSLGTILRLNRQDGEVVIETRRLDGDFDGDFNLSAIDGLAALKMSVGLLPEDLNLDMDSDGRITARDARIILQIALGL